MNPYLRCGLIALGSILLFLGVIGLFLPVLQGIASLLLGLCVFSLVSWRLKRTIRSHLSAYPRISALFVCYESKVERVLGIQKREKGRETVAERNSFY